MTTQIGNVVDFSYTSRGKSRAAKMTAKRITKLLVSQTKIDYGPFTNPKQYDRPQVATDQSVIQTVSCHNPAD
jgi:hypothetical protein